MNATDWQQPGGGYSPEGPPMRTSGWPNWIKLVIVLILMASLGWVLLLATQYFRTGQPIERLPGVSQVADLFGGPPEYVHSIYGVERPLGVAVGESGKVYVTESGGERKIHVYDSDGVELSSFAPPDTGATSRVPVYIAVSPQGEVYVSDRQARTIYIFSEDGTPLGEVPPPAAPEMWHPLGMDFDAAGNLYVTDVSSGNHRVLVLDPAGHLKLEFGSQGSAEGEFWFPNAVAVDDQGRIYVSDSNNGRVQVFDSSGQFLVQVGRGLGKGELSLPRGIAIDGDNHLFVVDTSRQAVQMYDISESIAYRETFGGDQGSDSVFSYPNGLALDGQGGLYVTDRENDRVQFWRY